MSTAAPFARFRLEALRRPGFHLQMAYASAVIVIISIVGCELTSTHVAEAGYLVLGFGFAIVVMSPVVLLLEEKGKLYLRDALLTIFWSIFFLSILGFPVVVAARLDLHIPLQDARFVAWDRWLGVDVSSISGWASSNSIGRLITWTYAVLFPFMQFTILLPILTGRVKYTQRFLTANLAAFAIGLPLFALFPGVGPWYGLHLAARPDQTSCTALVLLIRHPGPFLYQYPSGAICFPSFHVIWAVLCAYGLWGFRWLRIPVCLFSGIIILSTLTVGNHYLCDVLAGFAVAGAAIVISERLSTRLAQRTVPQPEGSGRPHGQPALY